VGADAAGKSWGNWAFARLTVLDRAHSAAEVTYPKSVYRCKNTERSVMATQGTNRIVGNDPGRIVSEALAALDGEGANRSCGMDGRRSEL